MKSRQEPLDSLYIESPEEEILEKIARLKATLGNEVLILCHHYQQEAVYRFADITGDSLKLAREAAKTDSPFVVFCGVHFMAESADMLTGARQAVILPDLRAGCPMADMATVDDALMAWNEISEHAPGQRTLPVTYVNSSARIKAFVGEKGGAVCTSSNAARVLPWALAQGDKALFLPDEHLGRNTAHLLGIEPERIIVWQRGRPLGGNSPEAIRSAKVILWNGYCSVHMQFTYDHVRMWRKKDPDLRIIVHPECRHEVVQAADMSGSTEQIIAAVSSSPTGSRWAVGTEVNLVDRLRRNHPDKEIHSLSPFQCLCSTMYRIKPGFLLWVLDNLAAGRIVNRITVDEPRARLARLALDRMLAI